MKFMVFVKANEMTEAGEMPSAELITAMGKYNQALLEAGVMLGGDGLKPSSQGARVLFNGDGRTVVDGPFAETKELVAGYWLWECKSLQEAVDWAKRCPNPTGDQSVLEIRPLYTEEDFAEAMTPEMRAHAEQLRTKLAGQA